MKRRSGEAKVILANGSFPDVVDEKQFETPSQDDIPLIKEIELNEMQRTANPKKTLRDDTSIGVQSRNKCLAVFTFILLILFFFVIIFVISFGTPLFRLSWRHSLEGAYGTSNFVPLITFSFLFIPICSGGVFYILARNHIGGSPLASMWTKTRRIHVPYVGQLTSNELFLILIFFVGNVCWIGFRLQYDNERGKLQAAGYIKCIAKGLGMNAMSIMAFLCIPSTQHSYILEASGVSYNQSIRYHKWLGYAFILLLFFHGALYWISWFQRGIWRESALPCPSCSRPHKSYRNFSGEVAFLLACLMLITSLDCVRRRCFELFYSVHHMFVLVFLLSCVHYRYLIWWLLPSITLYILHKVRSISSRSSIEVKSLQTIGKNLIKLEMRRKKDTRGHFLPGQFLYIKVPSISYFQWHPFSISSAPSDNPNTFTVHIRACGDFSTKLYQLVANHSELDQGPTVLVDGFYGNGLPFSEGCDCVLFIAGGIGATPLLSMIKELKNKMISLPVLHRTFPNEIWLIWTAREKQLFFEFKRDFHDIRSADPESEVFHLELYLTQSESSKEESPILRTQAERTLKLSSNHHTRSKSFPFGNNLRGSFLELLLFLCVFVSMGVTGFYFWWNTSFSSWWIDQTIVFCSTIVVGLFTGLVIAYLPFQNYSTHQNRNVLGNMIRRSRYQLAPLSPTPLNEQSIKKGRPDLAKVIDRLHNHWLSNNLARKVGVVVCGPEGMIKETQEICSHYQSPLSFQVHVESFSL